MTWRPGPLLKPLSVSHVCGLVEHLVISRSSNSPNSSPATHGLVKSVWYPLISLPPTNLIGYGTVTIVKEQSTIASLFSQI